MQKGGKYIVFEGQDGAGKSTQMAKIAKRLMEEGYPCVLFREPGGELGSENPLGEKIRQMVQDPEVSMTPLCELGLFMSNRAELMPKIQKLLDEGKNVICDRNYLSSVVYQGFGRGISTEKIQALTELFEIRRPDFVALYLCSKSGSRSRIEERGEPDRFEREDDGFLSRVSQGYLKLPKLLDDAQIPHLVLDTTEAEWESYENQVWTELKKIL